MERLSDKCPCNTFSCSRGGQCDYGCDDYAEWVSSVRQKLEDYEKAEEEGRLIELPCKPSDVTVYQLRSKKHALGIGVSPRHISAATVWVPLNCDVVETAL